MLLESGSAEQNAPVWYWMRTLDRDAAAAYFYKLAISDTEEVRAGAIWRLRRYKADITSDQISDLIYIASSGGIKIQQETALYVGDIGFLSHLEALNTLNVAQNHSVRSAVISAKTKILCKRRIRRFLRRRWQILILSRTFIPLEAIDETLSETAAHLLQKNRSDDVRYQAAMSLNRRGLITEDVARTLSNDNDLDVRSVGFRSLIRMGEFFTTTHLRSKLESRSSSLLSPSRKVETRDVIAEMYEYLPTNDLEAEVNFVSEDGAIACWCSRAKRNERNFFEIVKQGFGY